MTPSKEGVRFKTRNFDDHQLEELMQMAGEMIDPLCGDLQRFAHRHGFPADLPPEVIFCALAVVALDDLWTVTRRVCIEIDDILCLYEGATA